MDLLLVFATLAFCGVVVGMYLHTSSLLNAAVVSPVLVLEAGDESIFFEREESVVVREVVCEFDSVDEMKIAFCSRFNSMNQKSFLTSNTQPINDVGINVNNLCEHVYTFTKDGDGVRVERDGLEKKIILDSNAKSEELCFNMRMNYRLKKEYLLTKGDCR